MNKGSGARRMMAAVAAMAVAIAMACGEASEADEAAEVAPADDRLSVYVVNYPLQYFAERIGGEHVDVRFPAPRDVDPAEWMPSLDTIIAYQEADLILRNGANYAQWMRHVSLPTGAQVDTSRAFRDRLLEVPDAVTHAHGPDGEVHTHAGIASTTWLDPTLAIEHARAVKDALTDRLPAHAEGFDERFAALAAELEALDERLREVFEPLDGRRLLASRAVYHYIEARYGVEVRNMAWEPDAMPDDAAWVALDEKLAERSAPVMLWHAEPDEAIASRLRERGVAAAVYDPCAQPPEQGDLLSVMGRNADELAVALGG